MVNLNYGMHFANVFAIFTRCQTVALPALGKNMSANINPAGIRSNLPPRIHLTKQMNSI